MRRDRIAEDGAAASERDPDTGFDRLETDSRLCAVLQRPVIQEASGERNSLGNGQSERKEDKLSISEDEAEKAYSTEYWNDGSGCKKVFAANTDDLQEAYIRGREAPPSDVEVEAVAKRLLWRSCKKWDGIESDYAAKDEDDAWDFAGVILGMRECYAAQARDLLEIARKAVNE